MDYGFVRQSFFLAIPDEKIGSGHPQLAIRSALRLLAFEKTRRLAGLVCPAELAPAPTPIVGVFGGSMVGDNGMKT